MFNLNVVAQTNWPAMVKKANEYSENKNNRLAALYYDKSFILGNSTASDYYNAACCYSILKKYDSAFARINSCIKYGYTNVEQFQTDKDFNNIRHLSRWNMLISNLKKQNFENDLKYGSVKRELEKAYSADQRIRKLLVDSIFKKYGEKSLEADSIKTQMKLIDSANINTVVEIIDKYGWLGPSEIGEEPSLTIFLIVQHSNLATQEKYLPVMKEAVKNGKAVPQNLALLEDRVHFFKGEKQIYGSQVIKNKTTNKYELYPVEDEKNVNTRRLSMGLPSIEEYLQQFGISYKLQ